MDLIKNKILITGAPSSGKSSTMSKLAEIYQHEAVLIPESAIVLLSGGFPTPEPTDIEQMRIFQQALIEVQKALEFIFVRQNYKADLMIFDRSVLDGAAFWPEGINSYLENFKIDIHNEYLRFNYVLFFELPDKAYFGGKNKQRFHDYEQCLESEKQLKMLWENHPNFLVINATKIFNDKIESAISLIQKIVINHQLK